MRSPQQIDSPWRLAVLISGSGRSLSNLLRAIAAGDVNAEVVTVISSAADVRGLQIAAAVSQHTS